MINITEKELQQFALLKLENSTHNNGGNIYIKDNKLIYKIFKDFYSYQKEIERNIEFQIKNSIPYTPKIYDKLSIDGKFSGYIMEYIPNSLTFREAIGQKIDQATKLSCIKNIYEALKYLHKKNIFLGDVHLDNFLISFSGYGYLIDLDYMRFPGDEYKFQQCYLIKPNNNSYKINVASKYTDNIKVMISCLSLLLEIDLEKYISKDSSYINLEEIYFDVILPLNNNSLNNYLERLMCEEETEYFSDYLDSENLHISNKR